MDNAKSVSCCANCQLMLNVYDRINVTIHHFLLTRRSDKFHLSTVGSTQTDFFFFFFWGGGGGGSVTGRVVAGQGTGMWREGGGGT